ncbi:MAG: chorismate--pyruvate lyase family protein [Gammaproteobacteria bacterium]
MTVESGHDLLETLDLHRLDLQETLRQSTIDPRSLSSFQRILLTTDGTVTDILEAYLWESMQVVKLDQGHVETTKEIPYLDLGRGADIMARKILLRGKTSHKNYIYAESIVVPGHLNQAIRDGLEKTKKPVGQLMLESRLETFREILVCRRESAQGIGQYFDIQPDDMLISRTYRVFAEGRPMMLITEKFPEKEFQDLGR